MLDEAHFEKWEKARCERERWANAVQSARETFGEDQDLTRWAKAQLADAEVEYGSVRDILTPLGSNAR
jgi:hypothetical protein